MITLDKNKNLGILFQLRSGSTALQQYLANLTGQANIMELFNAYNNNNFLTGPVAGVTCTLSPRPATPVSLTPWPTLARPEDIAHLNTRLLALNQLNADGKLGVFKINVSSYINENPTFSSQLAATNTQFINLERADVLYSIISRFVSTQTRDWAIFGGVDRPINVPAGTTYTLSVAQLTIALDEYKAKKEHITTYFPSAPTIYYEEFQNNEFALTSMFAGPIGGVGQIATGKFTDNHKLLISNLAEVEAAYAAYVNANKAYFPASFNTLPGITIPALQGNQPVAV